LAIIREVDLALKVHLMKEDEGSIGEDLVSQ